MKLYNLLRSFVIIAVFACISCSHQRKISDGGLSTNSLEGSEQPITADASESTAPSDVIEESSENEDNAVAEDSEDLEAVASNAVVEKETGDVTLLSPEESNTEGNDVLVAKNDTPVQLVPSTEDTTITSNEIANEVTPSPEEIAAAVSAQAGADTMATLEKKPTPKRAWRKKVPSAKQENKQEVAPVQAVAPVAVTEPVPAQVQPIQPEVVKPNVVEPVQRMDMDDEEIAKPQEAGVGLAEFIEEHAFVFATSIIGLIVCMFLFAKRRKATDDGFNL
jgi:hypothetical protein